MPNVLFLTAILAATGANDPLKLWSANTHPTDVERSHAEEIAAGEHHYTVTQSGTMDGRNCRSPMGCGISREGAFLQTWESNRSVRMENIGQTDVVNPWLSNGRNNFRSVDEIVSSAITSEMSDAERAFALWFQEIRYRHHSPGDNAELGDPVKVFNIYGYNTCGNDSICLGTLWKAAGLRTAPARSLGHCISQAFYDGRWHFYDGDLHCVYLLRDNETVAGEQDIVRDHDLIKRTHSNGILVPDATWRGQRMAAQYFYEGPVTGERAGRADTTMDMVLRPGEALVWRWGQTDPVKYHGKLKVSPTYKHVIYSGFWEYRPDFSQEIWRRGATSVENVVAGADGLRAGDGRTGTIVWKMRSPYVFVGGRLEADAADVKFFLSADGETWRRMEENLDKFFSVVGPPHYEYQLKCELKGSARLRKLAIVNDIQMAPLTLPEMVVGENRFTYSDEIEGERRVRITHHWVERSASKPPEAPRAPVYPPDAGEAAGTDVIFRWAPPDDPDGDAIVDYHFELSNRADMKWPLSMSFYKFISRTNDVVRQKDPTTRKITKVTVRPQYTLPQPGLLTPDRTYYWRVRAQDAEGVWGTWSRTWSFTPRGPAYPLDVKLEYDRGKAVGTLRWKPNPVGARPVKYRVYGSDEKGFTIAEKRYQSVRGITEKEMPQWFPANFIAETTGMELSVLGRDVTLPGANKTYYQVVAIDGQGKHSGPSDYATAPKPVIYSRPVTAATVGTEYRYPVRANRSLGGLSSRMMGDRSEKGYFDIEKPKFELKQGPAWLRIDESTGLLAGTPDAPGRVNVAITATIYREVRKLDEAALKWGREKVLSVTTQRVGTSTQEFVIDVHPRGADITESKSGKGSVTFEPPDAVVVPEPAPVRDQATTALPHGVEAVWSLDRAHRRKTATREHVCINGLWRWQPVEDDGERVPSDGWGYCRVPGVWPGRSQRLHHYPHPSWSRKDLQKVDTAWYQREISIPKDWNGRRIHVYTEYLHSFAAVYVNGNKAGDILFPYGELDITAACAPGTTHVLSLRVAAMPLAAVITSYSRTGQESKVRGGVERPGMCGDVFLISTPRQSRIRDVKVNTSVRQWEIACDTALVVYRSSIVG